MRAVVEVQIRYSPSTAVAPFYNQLVRVKGTLGPALLARTSRRSFSVPTASSLRSRNVGVRIRERLEWHARPAINGRLAGRPSWRVAWPPPERSREGSLAAVQ